MNGSSQRAIGLTGGIASGKTTVARYLGEQYGFPIYDADLLAREAVAQDSPILQRVVDRYGREILQADGTLDRPRLGQVIFQRPQERRWLEAQIHPYVRQRLQTGVETAAGTVVLVVPLLLEAQMTDLVTEVWVVYCTREQQLQRLQQRNGYNEEEARSRIAAQMPLQDKCQYADLVLDNRGDATIWQQQIQDRLG